MRLSFYDKESFMEAAGGFRFSNPPSDPDTNWRMGSIHMPPQGQERSEDV